MASSNATIVSNDSDPEPPRNSSDKVLSRINLSFHESKADQIFRLVQDQEELNKKFTERALHLQDDHCAEGDNSLSDSSFKETEKRLSQRLSVHKQKGGRSKTSMGFHNGKNIINNSSSDEEETKMADEERMINTRINRPKSSYVRRRHLPADDEDESPVDSTAQRRCRSTRPTSRLGKRDVEGSYRECPSRHEGENRKMVLTETSFNVQAPPATPTNDIIDPIGYDRYAHIKTPVPCVEPDITRERTGITRERTGITRERTGIIRERTGIRRERTDLRSTNKNSENTNTTNTSFSKAQYEKHARNRQREDTMSEISTRQRHRRQQYGNVRANRPTSENVYLVRQRTEARLLKNGNSTSNMNNRPKSDRVIMTSNGPKPILSIDSNPVNSTTLNYQKNSVQSSQNTTLDYTSSSRPMSRRGRSSQEVPNRPPGVIANRPPLSLMKLPPLDSSVSKRAERTLALTTARETCV